MANEHKHITINILPQDSAAWFWIAILAIGVSICWSPTAKFREPGSQIEVKHTNGDVEKYK